MTVFCPYMQCSHQTELTFQIYCTGNLGTSLVSSSRAVRLYFSHDGGVNWIEVDAGFWEFQFAALGSIVVTVQKRRSTNFVRWSCDEGKNWTQSAFHNSSSVFVVGMLTERGEKARHVT